jgi:YD repeat-containing protein
MARVPILVPPGRSGIQPNLNLTYNSYQGNGWIGVGWNLDVGSIQRSTRYGVDYTADDYVVVKEGSSSELVERDDWGAEYYGAKIEGGFARYRYNGEDGWEVTAKDGTTYFYGTTPASRQDDPADSSRVFRWCLDRVQDANGNTMTVAYVKDQGQIYLDEILYTANGGLGPANAIRFYLEERDDAPAVYTPYFAVRTAYRLGTIEILAHEAPVRAYELIYDADPQTDGLQYRSSTGRSLLLSVQQYGSDARVDPQTGEVNGGSALPPLFMDNIRWPDSAFSLNGSQIVAGYNGESQLVPMDFNGDGRSDFIIHHDGGTLQRYVSNGSAFEYIGKQTVAGFNGESQLVPLDMNGDGLMDFIIRHDGGTLQRYLSDGEQFESIGSQTVAGYNGESQLVPMDFNGDGRSDFIIRHDGGTLQRYVSNGTEFEYSGYQVVAGYGGDAQLVPLDINGDGLMGFIIRHSDGTLQRYLSDGDQFEYTGSQEVTRYNQNNELVPLDINGDGRTDFITRSKDGNLKRYISNGAAFEKNGSQSVAGYNGESQLAPLDFNGDGRSDLIIRHDGGRLQRYISDGEAFVYIGKQKVAGYNGESQLVVMDIDGNGNREFVIRHDGGTLQRYFAFEQKTDLLSSITNGLGATTWIKYTASSAFKNKRLPMIVHPVSEITIDDGLGNQSVTKISYSGGLYEPATREFRGFEIVTRLNAVETPFTTITETKFHQDQWLKGRQYEAQLREQGENGALLSKTTFTWDKQFLDPPADSAAFVKLQQKLSESYDGVTIFTRENYTYDDSNGNLLSKTASGTGGEDVAVHYAYANLADWMWRKTRETVVGSVSGKVRESYDGYESGTGNLIYREFWLDGAASPKIETAYDEYGNPIAATDARGHTTITEYDTLTRTFPVKIVYPQTNGVSHSVENEAWDYRFGKVTITKDENGNRTYYNYDAFGRPLQVDLPDGGRVTTEYHDEEFPRYVVNRVKEDAAGSTSDAYRYVDGLGREIQTITYGEGGKSIVFKKFYDALGRNDLNEGPFFATGTDYPLVPSAAYPWQQTTFDLRGRPEAIESADGEYGSVVAFFDYNGLATTVTDPDGGSKTEKKDYLGRVTRVIEHGDQSDYMTDYTYNAAGDLLTVKDHSENKTTINYDTLGRKINMNDPDMGYWEYTYDANGNLLTQLDEKLQKVTFTYDELNRVTAKAYSTSDSTVTYTYDNLTIPNGRGRLYSVANAHSTATYQAYDKMGNVTAVSKTISGDAAIYNTQYEYDLTGKVTKTIYPDGYAVSNTYYPGSGLLQTVSGSDGIEYARLSGYAPTGKIGSIEHANGVYTSYTYDAESTRLTAIVTTRSGPTPDLQNKSYQYTPAGDIQRISDAVNNIDYDYIYDNLHRLIGESNTGAYDPVSYTYNAIGNITSKTVGDTTLTYSYDEWHKHAVKSIGFNGHAHTYRYDDNGNMIEAPDFTDRQQVATRSITYNADNMPVRIHYENGRSQSDATGSAEKSSESSNSASFRVACWINTVAGPGDEAWTVDFYYDGDGARVKKHVLNGSRTYYIGAHYEVKDGVATRYIFAGNLRIAMLKDTEEI